MGQEAQLSQFRFTELLLEKLVPLCSGILRYNFPEKAYPLGIV